MGEFHLIQPEPLAARDDGADAHGVPVGAHREKLRRGYLVFLRAMPYGRLMREVNQGALLIAGGWGASQVAVMLFRDLTATR
jgi:hypothetical protein